MNVPLLIFAFLFMTISAFSQISNDSIAYRMLSKDLEEILIYTNVQSVINERYSYQQNEESLVFYNRRNEIFKFLFNEKGISEGYYILWLYEMIETSGDEAINWGEIKNYSVHLSEQELYEIRGINCNQLLKLADTSLFLKNLDTLYLDLIALPTHHGEFGVIYKSNKCDIEYFEADSLLTAFDQFLQNKLNTNAKRKKILKNLDFKFYSFGGCSYTYYQNLFQRIYNRIIRRLD